MKSRQNNLLTSSELRLTSAFKGLAILAVITLHVLANIKLPIYLSQPWQFWSVFLDQLSRFCVPVFVALSGYGLMRRYGVSFEKNGGWQKFFIFWYRRSRKLLPGFFLWSIIISLAIKSVSEWQWLGVFESYWLKFILGQADYHLYFIPMIFQLYILFPFIVFLLRKQRILTLLLTGMWHILLVYFIDRPELAAVLNLKVITDQLQYLFFGTWIWYFLLGIAVADFKNNYNLFAKKFELNLLKIILMTGAACALVGSVLAGQTKIIAGIDPVLALKFTTPFAALYSTLVVLLLLMFLTANESQNKKLYSLRSAINPLAIIGSYSYLIYLSHTLLLRIIFSFYYHLAPTSSLIAPSLLFVVGLWLSRKLKISG